MFPNTDAKAQAVCMVLWLWQWRHMLLLNPHAVCEHSCDRERHFFFLSSKWMQQTQHRLPPSTKGKTKTCWRWSQFAEINIFKAKFHRKLFISNCCQMKIEQKWQPPSQMLLMLHQKIQAGQQRSFLGPRYESGFNELNSWFSLSDPFRKPANFSSESVTMVTERDLFSPINLEFLSVSSLWHSAVSSWLHLIKSVRQTIK